MRDSKITYIFSFILGFIVVAMTICVIYIGSQNSFSNVKGIEGYIKSSFSNAELLQVKQQEGKVYVLFRNGECYSLSIYKKNFLGKYVQIISTYSNDSYITDGFTIAEKDYEICDFVIAGVNKDNYISYIVLNIHNQDIKMIVDGETFLFVNKVYLNKANTMRNIEIRFFDKTNNDITNFIRKAD